MDPQARVSTWELIRQLKAAGVTVLLTTHYLEEAERLADRVAIIDGGRLVALGSPTALTRGDATRVQFRAVPGLDLAALAALPVRWTPPSRSPASTRWRRAPPPTCWSS